MATTEVEGWDVSLFLIWSMEKPVKELERAQLLDDVLKIIQENYPEGRAYNPVYIRHHLQQRLKVQNFLLIKYIEEEGKSLKLGNCIK